MAHVGFPLAPTIGAGDAEHVRQVAEVANGARGGKINSVEEVTLTNSSTTTTLTDARIGVNSCIIMTPLTADAKTEGHPHYTTDNGSATITHSSDTTTRTYRYAVLG